MPRYIFPRRSMYGIFTYIYHRFKPNVGRYTSPMEHMGFAPIVQQILAWTSSGRRFIQKKVGAFWHHCVFKEKSGYHSDTGSARGAGLQWGDLLPQNHPAPRDFVSGTMFRLDYEHFMDQKPGLVGNACLRYMQASRMPGCILLMYGSPRLRLTLTLYISQQLDNN